ncbi:MAG: sugar transferase [Blastomonas sp.]
MNVAQTRQTGLPDFSILNSFRMQALLCVIFGALLPTFAYFFPEPSRFFDRSSTHVSLAASTVAVIVGIYFSRRVTAFPGTTLLSSALPSFAIAFGALALGILVLRIPYSGAILTMNAICCSIVIILLALATSRIAGPRFHLVPGERARQLLTLQEIDCEAMARPQLPDRRNAFIVADLHQNMAPEWERMLALATLKGIPVFHYKQVYESVSGKVQIEHLSENNFGALLPSIPYAKVKRLIDLVMAIIALPLLLIPMLIVALLVKLDSPGPVLFRQERMGYRGSTFQVIKIRTMHAAQGSDGRGDASHAMTQDNDMRVTRIGRFLRRTRIDELPQIINILRGEMSWIGPRPEAVSLSEWYESELPFYAYRHIVRPGITGWAQVNQGHVTELDSINTKLQYDFFYIKNFSYWIDILIAVRTVMVLVSGFGSR